MKINQIIVEAEQLDELGLADVGRGIGSVAGKTAQGLGAVAGGVKGAWDAAKSGYQSGKSFVGGQRVGGSQPPRVSAGAPASAPAARPAPTTQSANQPGSGNTGTFADMDDQELEQMKSFIDRELQLRRSGNPPGGRGGTPPSGGATPPPTSGGTPSAGRPAPAPAGGGTGATRQPTRDQIIQGPDGRPYQWLGNQWAAYNPATGRAGQVARRDVGAQLTQAVASGSARPYTPPAGGSTPPPQPAAPARGTTATPAAPAAAAQSPYGNLTASQQQFVAAREKEGLSQDQIKAALAAGGGGGGKRPPLTRPAQLNTVGGVPGIRTDMPMSQADPASFAAGQQRKAELDAANAAAIERSKAKRGGGQPANEGFYSRFLDRKI